MSIESPSYVRPPLPSALDGPWTFRTTRPRGTDVDLVHRWMNDREVARFWNQAWRHEEWTDELSRQLDDGSAGTPDAGRPCIVDRDGRPVAYLELYWACRHLIAQHYDAGPFDVGVHIAIGEPAARGAGWGSALLADAALGMFDALDRCTRVLAEPDAANRPALRAFARAGFTELGEIELPHKRAVLVARDRLR